MNSPEQDGSVGDDSPVPLGHVLDRMSIELAALGADIRAVQDLASPLLASVALDARAIAVFQNLDLVEQSIGAIAGFLSDLDLGSARSLAVRTGSAAARMPLCGLAARLTAGAIPIQERAPPGAASVELF